MKWERWTFKAREPQRIHVPLFLFIHGAGTTRTCSRGSLVIKEVQLRVWNLALGRNAGERNSSFPSPHPFPWLRESRVLLRPGVVGSYYWDQNKVGAHRGMERGRQCVQHFKSHCTLNSTCPIFGIGFPDKWFLLLSYRESLTVWQVKSTTPRHKPICNKTSRMTSSGRRMANLSFFQT